MMGTLRETAKEPPHGRRAGSTRRAARGQCAGRRSAPIGNEASCEAGSGQGGEEGPRAEGGKEAPRKGSKEARAGKEGARQGQQGREGPREEGRAEESRPE